MESGTRLSLIQSPTLSTTISLVGGGLDLSSLESSNPSCSSSQKPELSNSPQNSWFESVSDERAHADPGSPEFLNFLDEKIARNRDLLRELSCSPRRPNGCLSPEWKKCEDQASSAMADSPGLRKVATAMTRLFSPPRAEKVSKDQISGLQSGAVSSSVSAKDSPTAIVLQLEVKEDCVNEFIQVMRADAIGSRSEAGCLRFDLLRDKDNPCKFITYEVFENAAAMDVHKEMPYVKAWGAFQYGGKKPIISKKLLKTDAINFQDKACRAPKTPPIALVLEVEVKKECVEEFVQVMTADALGSRSETGCLRFDLLRDKENPCKFISYEVFRSQEAMDVHRDMAYVKAWGAFQYGEKKPVVKKALIKIDAMDFQAPEEQDIQGQVSEQEDGQDQVRGPGHQRLREAECLSVSFSAAPRDEKASSSHWGSIPSLNGSTSLEDEKIENQSPTNAILSQSRSALSENHSKTAILSQSKPQTSILSQSRLNAAPKSSKLSQSPPSSPKSLDKGDADMSSDDEDLGTASMSRIGKKRQRTPKLTLRHPVKPTRLVFLVTGMRGDVQPYVVLANTLVSRGYAVTIITNSNHVDLCRSLCLEVSGLFYDTDELIVKNETIQKQMWDGDEKSFIKAMSEPSVTEQVLRNVPGCWKALEDFGPDIIVYGAPGFALVIGEAYAVVKGIPSIPMHLQGPWPTKLYGPSGRAIPFGRRLDLHLRLWDVFAESFYKSVVGQRDAVAKALDLDLSSLGVLRPRWFEEYFFHPESLLTPLIVGYTGQLGTVPEDWAAEISVCGWWRMKEEAQLRRCQRGDRVFGGETWQELKNFVNAGPPPVYIGWGSMVARSREFMTLLAVRALKLSGQRGIVLKGWANLDASCVLGEPDSEELKEYCALNVLFVKVAPHAWLFPRCACVVHHGGSGTTAASVFSGIPTVITPVFLDQWDWAQCITRIKVGFGTRVPLRDVTHDMLAQAICKCCEDEVIRLKAKSLAARLQAEDGGEDGLAQAADVIDHFVRNEFRSGNWRASNAQMIEKYNSQPLKKTPLWLKLATFCCSFDHL